MQREKTPKLFYFAFVNKNVCSKCPVVNILISIFHFICHKNNSLCQRQSILSHHLHPNKLLEEIEGNYMVHCVQTLPSNGSEVISSSPFWCCFFFCLFLLRLGQTVEKLKADKSMKLSFGFSEAGAVYFTSKSLFYLIIYFYLKRNWDSLQHFRLATPAYFVPRYGFSASEKVRFFSLLQSTASKRDSHS